LTGSVSGNQKKIPMKKRPVVFQPAFLFLAANPVVIHYAKLGRTASQSPAPANCADFFSKTWTLKSFALVSNNGSRFNGKAVTMTSTNKKPAPHTQRGDPKPGTAFVGYNSSEPANISSHRLSIKFNCGVSVCAV
jgi:hypothetical protein